MVCSSCKPQEEVLEGDLYFSDWIGGVNFYNVPDHFYQNFIKRKDSIGYDKLIKEQPGLEIIRMLDKNDLLKSTYIKLRIQEDSIVVIFMDSFQYHSFLQYDYSQLIESSQKIRVKLRAEKISNGLWVCKSIITSAHVSGQTFMKRDKFKVENYR